MLHATFKFIILNSNCLKNYCTICIAVFRYFILWFPPVPQYYDIYNNCYQITRYDYPSNYLLLNGYTFRPLNRTTVAPSTVYIYPVTFSYSNQCPNTINTGGGGSQDKS